MILICSSCSLVIERVLGRSSCARIINVAAVT